MSDQPIPGPGSDHLSLSRRTFLRAAGATGAVALSPAVLRKRAEAQETPSPVRPDPAAKRGGTLRYGVHNAPAHFDVHQSGTVANIGPQAPDVRLPDPARPEGRADNHPRPGLEMGHLAGRQEVHVLSSEGVKFHDGADFTAEDVKATYERIVRPPKGVVIPRSSLFTTVSDIVVLDPHKIEFRLTEARPKAFMLGSFASGWNIIVRRRPSRRTRAISGR
jgi:ABC-type transport system substrate-binding protein